MGTTKREDMPGRIGEAVTVADGRYGRCRTGYAGDSPSAGHFEVEFSTGQPELFLWEEVALMGWPIPKGAVIPDVHANYAPRYGEGGVFHPVDGSRDNRYTVTSEYCGYEKARPVVRFAGEFISSHLTASEAWRAGRTHQRERRAALLGTPVTGEHGTS